MMVCQECSPAWPAKTAKAVPTDIKAMMIGVPAFMPERYCFDLLIGGVEIGSAIGIENRPSGKFIQGAKKSLMNELLHCTIY